MVEKIFYSLEKYNNYHTPFGKSHFSVLEGYPILDILKSYCSKIMHES